MRTLGLEQRCSVVEGNFFESVPPGGDAYLMRHVIHDWTDAQSVQILSNCRKVIPPQGRVLLVEFAVSAANEASLGKDADMIMLAFPGGKERTEQEYRTLFRLSFEQGDAYQVRRVRHRGKAAAGGGTLLSREWSSSESLAMGVAVRSTIADSPSIHRRQAWLPMQQRRRPTRIIDAKH